MAVGLAAVVATVLAGVLTALTPGLYPLIPVTVLTFGEGAGRRLLGVLAYAAGVGAVLILACAMAAGLGVLAHEPVHSAAGFGFLTLICWAMGAAILGAFPFQLPPSWAAWLAQLSGRGGPFRVGLVSLPVAAPWMAPPVLVLGALAMHLAEPLHGALLAGSFAMGLVLPWLGVGLSGGRAPSGGVWMEVVRLLLAAAMWTVGLYFLTQGWPALLRPVMALRNPMVAAFALVSAGTCGGALMLTSRRFARAPWLRTLAALLLCLGEGVGLHAGTADVVVADMPAIAWQTSHDAALTQARLQHRPLVLDFTADWCQPCKQLEQVTYVDRGVRREAMRFVMAKIDCTAMDAATQALFERYGITGLPTVLFFDSQGKLLSEPRLTGFVGPTRFLDVLGEVR